MAIRTNCTTWFRTTYTGSAVSSIVLSPQHLGMGNTPHPTIADSSSQLIYGSEPSRSYFDYTYMSYLRDDNVATPSVTAIAIRSRVNEDSGSHAGLAAPPAYSAFDATIGYGQTGDPISIMQVLQQASDSTGDGNVGFLKTFNQSASFDSMYWTISANPGFGAAVRALTHRASLSYQYDDTSLTHHTKTVRLPINSIVGNNAVTNNTVLQLLDVVGSIPALDTFLPEANKVYRDIVVEFYSFSAVASSTNIILYYQLDNELPYTGSLYGATANGGVMGYDTWRISGIDTSVSHSIYVRSNVTSTFSGLGAVLNVTYTYNVPSSSRVLNSLVLDGFQDSGTAQTSTVPNTYSRQLNIAEPGTIELRQSGYLMFACAAATQVLSVKVNNQPYTNYRLLQGSVNSGMYPLIHRIDSAATASQALTLQRGVNEFNVSWYASAGNVVGGVSGLLFLNYESDISSQGVGSHVHTIQMTMTGSIAAIENRSFLWPSSSFIPESNYYILGVAPVIYKFNALATDVVQLQMYYTGSEGPNLSGSGYITPMTSIFRNDAESGTKIAIGSLTNSIKRYPQHIDNLPDIQTRRRWTIQNINSSVSSGEIYLTYRSMTFPVNGTISGYAGNGQMPIKILDVANGNIVTESSSSVGGTISEIWYDDFTNLQILAYESGSVATSQIVPANSSSFVLNFGDAPTSTEHSYTFIG